MAEHKPLFTIPNLTANQVTEKKPWEFKSFVPETASRTKPEYREWLTRPTTPHCMYSCSEGAVAGMRVTDDNPIVKVHGLIADYDTVVSDELLLSALLNCPSEFRPNWVHKTPSSGGRRLIWMFQTPALVNGVELARVFLSIAAKKVKAKNFLPGFDYDALANPTIYYDVGMNWAELDTAQIPETFVASWMYDAGNLVTSKTFEGPVIPLDMVQKEMERRFPGRWAGPFERGSSGPRFWDATSDNPRACVVNRFGTGMHCFTGGTAFMPWVNIFGPAFTEKYKAETLGAVMAGTWFDNRVYWRKIDGCWFPSAADNYRLFLKVHHQLSSAKRPNRVSSELEDVIHAVNEQKVVHGAAPSVYFPDGPIMIDGERHLNISTVTVLSPASGESAIWGDGFPWLAKFLDAFLPEQKPREIFLGWLRRAYVSAYQHAPLPGQIVLIAGGVTRGKSLLSTVIISKLMGGSIDASDYFLGEEHFTHHVVSKPIWTIDDTVPSSTPSRHTRYSAMLKKIVANSEHIYERKFRDACKVNWIGRVIVTCNVDPESIRLLPNMDQSNADKINLFRCNPERVFPVAFPSRSELIKIIDRELPYLGRWLLHWEMPEIYIGTTRMGVVSYHDPMLIDSSTHAGESFAFMEVLQLFLGAYREAEPGAAIWSGTSSKLLSDMMQHEGIKMLVAKVTSIGVARYLGQLKSKGFALEQTQTAKHRLWHIPMSLVDDDPEEIKREGVTHETK